MTRKAPRSTAEDVLLNIRHTTPLILVSLISIGLLDATSNVQAAKPTNKQISDLQKINRAITQAGQLYQRSRFKESAAALGAVEDDLKKYSGTKDRALQQLVRPQLLRFNRARGLLRQKGVEIPSSQSAADVPPETAPDPNGPVSFVSTIAPLLVSKCSRCHINKSSGDFSVSTFESLMKGSSSGEVLFAEDSKGSRLMELVASGEMPPGSAKLAVGEVESIRKWIDQGARFDGQNPGASLTTLAADAVSNSPRTNLGVVTATGNETVSFAREIAPMLTDNCNGCHFNANNVQGGLRLDTFRQLLRGGDGGPVVSPGNSSASRLATMLKGEPGERMPRRRPALSVEAIAKIEKWIDEGATFDGGDPNMNLRRVAEIALASSASHAELEKQRLAQAQKYWALGMPDIDFHSAESENFLFVGRMETSELQQLCERAERLVQQLGRVMKIGLTSPVVKGRMTFFVFDRRYDYSEFGAMVEKRELPITWNGHWKYDIVDAYGTLVVSRQDLSNEKKNVELDASLTRQIVGTVVASAGTDIPTWFSEGVARVYTSRLQADNPSVRKWTSDLARSVSGMSTPDAFMKGQLAPEQSDIVSFGFIRFLMKDNARFSRLLRGLAGKQTFEENFQSIYRVTPEKAASAWLGVSDAKPRKGR